MIIGIDAYLISENISEPYKRGIPVYIKNLLRAMLKLSENMKFVLLSQGNVNLPSHSNLEILPLYYSFWKGYFIQIPKILKHYNISVFHNPANYGLPFSKVCAYVLTIHDIIPFINPKEFYPTSIDFLKNYFFSLLFSAMRADLIITPSFSTCRDIQHYLGISPKRIKIIPYGIDTRYFKRFSTQEIKTVKNKYSIPDKYILYVGAFDNRKNITGMLKSYALLPNSIKRNFSFVIVGSQKQYEEFRRLLFLVDKLKIKDFVRFTGYVPQEELPKIYQGAELLLWTSFYEGFGIPPLEAMASGIPVITSNTSSLPEVVGSAGILVNPYDIKELSIAIQEVIENRKLTEKLKKAGVERAKCFSWEKAAQETISVYKSLCDK